VLVAGLGVSGFAAADALAERGAHVIDRGRVRPGRAARRRGERARILTILDVDVRTGESASTAALPRDRLPSTWS
jgi:UDP-N-acetylmuramoylalanine--D-glutamate ligase